MAEDRNLKPLRNVILCSTGLTPDQRTELNSKATAMGASVNMDFTTTTTHLVAEKLNSLKYKFVAKNRLDVKVMGLEWVNDMHSLWVAGDDFDICEMEDKHKLPTFCGLKICVTSILEEERLRMIKLLEKNGAEYHPDLTRRVTHLVSPDTTGKKYHFAKKWKIIVVGPEWVYDSLDRGMVLEERFYDPRLPTESRGEGAKPEPPAAPVAPMNGLDDTSAVSLAGDMQAPAPFNPDNSFTKRKIRASAEGKFGSQNNDLWSSIMGQANNPKPKKVSEWEESAGDVHYPTAPASDGIEEPGPLAAKPRTGFFANINFYLLGFSDKEAVKLRDAIGSFDGTVIVSLNAFFRPLHIPERSIILVPAAIPRSQIPRPPPEMDVTVLRYWWLEQCMFMQRFVEPDEFGRGVLYRPVDNNTIDDFKGMKISSTGFSGIELLHVNKIVDLIGAQYSQQLKHHETDALIRNPASSAAVSGGKIDAADAWNIPIVDLPWLWDSIEQNRKLPFDKYLFKSAGLKRKRDEVRPPAADKRRRPSPPPAPFEEEEEVRKGEEIVESSPGPPERRSRAAEANDGRKSGTKRQSEQATMRGSRKILRGKRICISRALKDVADELGDLAESLGAEVVHSFDTDDDEPITHLIHRSKKPNDQTRDYRVAKTIPGVIIVSAAWLKKSSKAGKVLDEFGFPPYEDSRPTLLLAKSAPDTPPRNVAGARRRPVGGLKLGRLPFEEDNSTDDETRPQATVPVSHNHIEQQPLILDDLDIPPPPRSPTPPLAPSPARPFIDEVPSHPPSPIKKEPDNPVSSLLTLNPSTLSSLLAPAERPRRRGLKGRALSTLSANTASSSSRTPSGTEGKGDSQDADMSLELDGELPESTQSRVLYADRAENVLERRRVLEKVGGRVETPVVVRQEGRMEMRDVVSKKRRWVR